MKVKNLLFTILCFFSGITIAKAHNLDMYSATGFYHSTGIMLCSWQEEDYTVSLIYNSYKSKLQIMHSYYGAYSAEIDFDHGQVAVSKAAQNLIQSGQCPSFGTTDRTITFGTVGACIATDTSFCSTQSTWTTSFPKTASELIYDANTTIETLLKKNLEEIENLYYNNKNSFQKIWDSIGNEASVYDYVIKEVLGFSSNNEVPAFIETAVRSQIKDYYNAELWAISEEKIDDIEASIEKELGECLDQGWATIEECEGRYEEQKESIKTIRETIVNVKEREGQQNYERGAIDCSLFEDSKTFALLKRVLNFIRLLVPIILLIMTIMDYIKAITSHEQDAIKKSTNTLFKRTIIAFIIFFVPTVLDLLLDLIGYETCGL